MGDAEGFCRGTDGSGGCGSCGRVVHVSNVRGIIQAGLRLSALAPRIEVSILDVFGVFVSGRGCGIFFILPGATLVNQPRKAIKELRFLWKRGILKKGQKIPSMPAAWFVQNMSHDESRFWDGTGWY